MLNKLFSWQNTGPEGWWWSFPKAGGNGGGESCICGLSSSAYGKMYL
jgi:hypothetical protein